MKITPKLDSFCQLRKFVIANFHLEEIFWEMTDLDIDGDRVALENEEDFINMREYQQTSIVKLYIICSNQLSSKYL